MLTLLRPRPEALTDLDFDGVQRYSLAARLLDRLLGAADRPVRLLEVGANALNPWPQFLDAEQVRITRCDVQPYAGDPDFVLIEKDRPLPFADAAFDAVVSLEVLEHIPAAGRRPFLAECLRVARHGAVFTCPNGVPEVARAEALVNRAYAHRNSYPNPFLAEHEECGLPPEEQIAGILRGLGHPHAVFGNSPLAAWLPLLVFGQTLCERSPLAMKLHERLNQAFFPGIHDNGPLPYRKVYVVAKSAAAAPAVGPLPEMRARPGRGDGLPPELAHVQTLAAVAADVLTGLQADLLAREHDARHYLAELLHARQELQLARDVTTNVLRSRPWRLARLFQVARHVLKPVGYRREGLVAFLDMEPEADGGWRARGPGAQLVAGGLVPPGWVRLRLKVQSDGPALVHVEADTSEGFAPLVSCQPAHVRAGVEVERCFRFGEPVRSVRLRVAGPVRFRVEEFSFELLPLAQVIGRFARSHARGYRKQGGWLRGLGRDLGLLLTGRFGRLREQVREEMLRWHARYFTGPEAPAARPAAKAAPPAPVSTYEEWRRLHLPGAAERERMRAAAGALPRQPLFTVLLPVGGDVEPYLGAAVESVLRQAYPRWELWVAVEGTLAPPARAFVHDCARRDGRVRVVEGGDPLGAALAAAGDYVLFVGPGDELAEHALFRAAEAVAADPDLALLYSDEDRLDAAGRHVEPVFKPDWSPEHFLATPYTGHLCVYRMDLVREVGGVRGEFGPAREYDLALRLVARGGRVGHLADVLYHARRRPDSADAREKADAAARRALECHLGVINQPGRVEPGAVPGTHRVRFALAGRPKVSVVIPSACRVARPGAEADSHLGKCLRSLRAKTAYENYEILVVGHPGIAPALALAVADAGAAHVPYDGPLNVAAKMNLGAARAAGAHLLFLNDDTEVLTPDWLEALLEFSQRPEVGAVGPKLLYPDGRVQHAGIILYKGKPVHYHRLLRGDAPGPGGDAVTVRNFLAVTGACLMTRADVFRAAGGFSEDLPLDFNDVDYCLKVVAAGRRVVYQPFARLSHDEGVSKPNVYLDSKSAQVFRGRWAERWPHDPFYGVHRAVTADYPHFAEAVAVPPAAAEKRAA